MIVENNFILSLSIEPFVKAIMNSLNGEVYLVGGATRDLLLNKENKDIDLLVTGISIEDLSSILSKHGKIDLVGKSFGIIKYKQFGSDDVIDIAIPRSEKNNEGFLVIKDQSSVFIEYGGLKYESKDSKKG